jgi:hypothetical protein
MTEEGMMELAHALVVIEAEEEMPGEMPEGMYTWMKSLDKATTERFLRSIVRVTKDGIRTRMIREWT